MITCTFENGKAAGLRHVVVDILIVKKNSVLMECRAKHLVEGGKWALVGGFMDRDEHILDTVMREALEETGYRIRIVKLLYIADSIHRDASNRQNVALVFVAYPEEKIGEPDEEVTKLQWFDFDHLPQKEDIAFDHLHHIEQYLKSLQTNIPVIDISGRSSI